MHDNCGAGDRDLCAGQGNSSVERVQAIGFILKMFDCVIRS
jgi:hypothetical protein